MNEATAYSFSRGASGEASASAIAATITSQRSRKSVSRIASLDAK